MLAQNNLRQLAQRVTGRYHLEPLSKEESAKYIDHRMKVAGALGEIFDDGAKNEVYRMSGGIPRVMNVICDRALLGAYSNEQRTVDRSIVRRAAKEVAGESEESSSPVKWVAALAGLAALAVIVLSAIGLPRLLENSSLSAPPTEEAESSNQQPEALAEEEPPAAPTAPLGESLEDLLASGTLDTGPDGAMRELLALWEVRYDGSGGTACTQARASGLSCLWQRGSFSVLQQLDRPAVAHADHQFRTDLRSRAGIADRRACRACVWRQTLSVLDRRGVETLVWPVPDRLAAAKRSTRVDQARHAQPERELAAQQPGETRGRSGGRCAGP